MNNDHPPYYFIVVFWGKEHRDSFVDLSLASLLSENNIPLLENNGDNRFLICTTQEDWDALQDEKIFKLLKMYITPELIDLPESAVDLLKMHKMSSGHKLLTERAFQARACMLYTTPDTIFTDGYIQRAQELAKAGKKLVLTPVVRFEQEGVIEDLSRQGYLEKGETFCLSKRNAVAIGLRNKHPEFTTSEWTSPCMRTFPVYSWWQVPKQDAIVMHTYTHLFVIINYAALERHDTDTFEDCTIDGDYIHRNFDINDEGIYIVNDSDDVMVLPLSPKNLPFYSLKPERAKSLPVFGDWVRGYFLNNTYNSEGIDDFKRQLYCYPVIWHSGELTHHWKKIETNAQEIFKKYIFNRGVRYSIAYNIYLVILSLPSETLRYIVLIFAYSRSSIKALFGDPVERKRIKKRIELLRAKKHS